MNRDRFEELMVKVVDGVASPAEREALMDWVIDRPELRAELDAQLALKAVTDGWVERLALDLAEDRAAAAPDLKWGWRLGLGLLAAGYLVMAVFGLGELWMDPEVPRWIAAGYSAAAGGFLVLVITAIRWRLAVRKHDKYTEVVR